MRISTILGEYQSFIKDGFRGKIISTDATKDLALPMLMDTVMILGDQKEFELDTIYISSNSQEEYLSYWEGYEYHDGIQIRKK
jgi:hypothetical protein